jgi:class 3 adenylate cyclase/CheY-like chemotaxis protein
MGRNIWVIGDNRQEMIEAQRRINSTGGMRAVCRFSVEAVEQSLKEGEDFVRQSQEWREAPSLIILDYEMSQRENFRTVTFLKSQRTVAGVPLFFMTASRSKESDEECYSRGATVVLHKPFSREGITRIERTAWQYEVTRNYEKMLVQQAHKLQENKQILQLNEQLETRNRLLRQVFGQYFSDDILKEILDHPEGAGIGGKKRDLTVMMADLRGFTSISEMLEPENVTDVLNYFLTSMLPYIISGRGTVIEYLGDSILAVFGAPVYVENQTDRAVSAAIQMQNKMREVNEYCLERGYPSLEMGIAIHRGETFIGNVGSRQLMRYNVIGSVVNECSRMEGFSVGGQILISQAALEHIKSPLSVSGKQDIQAKGLRHPMTIYEVEGIAGERNGSISQEKNDVLVSVEEWVMFNMYPIEGKMIQETAATGRLLEFSSRRAVVLLEEEDVLLRPHMDVEIFAAAKTGKALLTEIYAKIIHRENRKITLRFTHVNKSFHKFSDRIGKQETGGNHEKR